MADIEKKILDTAELTDAVNEYQSGEPVENTEQKSIRFTGFDAMPIADDNEELVPVTFGELLRGRVQPPGDDSRNEFLEAAQAGYGTSRLDTRFGFRKGMDLEDARAKEQSFANKILSGLGKGAVTTMTTAANSTLGLAYGAGAVLFEGLRQVFDPTEQISIRGMIDAGTSNGLSKRLLDIQNAAEELMPNYKTAEERTDRYQDEWYKHMLTGNFIGDALIKNFGFTLGAMAAGVGTSKLLGKMFSRKLSADLMRGVVVSTENQATRAQLIEMANAIRNNGGVTGLDVGKLLANCRSAGKTIRNAQLATQLAGATIAALGEGTIEGLMAQSEFLKGFIPKMQQEYSDMLGIIDSDLYRQHPEWFEKHIEMGPDGNPVVRNVLVSEEGKLLRAEKQKALLDKYNRTMEYVEQQGKQLATTTCALNIPILMASDLFQFGKTFGRGWQTARRNLPKVKTGGITYTMSGSPAAEFTGMTKGVERMLKLGRSAKMALSEGMEEMFQGYVSSGAKAVADRRLTYFADCGYDPEAMAGCADWFVDMFRGGNEYLNKSANWQEGAVGAFTGMFGIPARHFRNWHGGIVEAVKTTRAEAKASRDAAEQLNSTINSEDFQKRWRGYIRHLKFSNEKGKAAEEDNQYAWHNADMKDLINDVVMFADAGRLDELDSWVDHMESMTSSDIEQIRDFVKSGSLEQSVIDDNTTDDEFLRKVHAKADDIRKAVKNYREVYNDLSSVVNPNLSSDRLRELVFTGVELKGFEDRFHDLLNETMAVIEPILQASSELDREGKAVTDNAEIAANLKRWQDTFNRAFSGNVTTQFFDMLTESELNKYLDQLESAAADWDEKSNGTTKWAEAVADMRKMTGDRKELIRKMASLRTITDEQFDAMKVTNRRMQDAVEGTQLNHEVAEFDSVSAVRAAIGNVSDRKERIEYSNRLRARRGENKHIDEYFKIQSIRSGINGLEREPAKSAEETDANTVASNILKKAAATAETADELLKLDVNSRILISEDEAVEDIRNNSSSLAHDDEYYHKIYADGLEIARKLLLRADLISKEVNSKRPEAPDVSYHGKPQPPKPAQPSTDGAAPVAGPPLDAFGFGGGTVPAAAPSFTSTSTVPPPAPAVAGGTPAQNQQQVPEPPLDAVGMNGGTVSAQQPEPEYTPQDAPAPVSQSAGQAEPAAAASAAPVSKPVVEAEPDPAVRTEEEFDSKPVRQVEAGGDDSGYSGDADRIDDDQRALAVAQFPYEPVDALSKGRTPVYYNTAIPECILDDVKRVQDQIEELKRKGALNEKITPPRLLGLTPSKGVDYTNVYNYLVQKNAFDNMAKLKFEDDKKNPVKPRLSFVIDPKLKDNNGDVPILIATVENGEVKILNVLRRNTAGSKYTWPGLDEMRTAVMNEYRAKGTREYKGGDRYFVFSRTSECWARRPGVITYYDESVPVEQRERPIKDISGFDTNGTIAVVRKDKDGNPYFANLRGSTTRTEMNAGGEKFLKRLRKMEEDARAKGKEINVEGRIYYLVRNTAKGFTPVRCNLEHFTLQNCFSGRQTGNPAYTKIYDCVDRLVKAFNDFNEGTIDSDEANRRKNGIFNDLSKTLDVWDMFFSIGTSKSLGNTLRFGFHEKIRNAEGAIIGVEKQVTDMPAEDISADNVIKAIARHDLPFQLRINWDVKDAGKMTAAEVAAEKERLSREKEMTVREFVQNGLLTSNAVALREQGTDLYFEVWNPKKLNVEGGKGDFDSYRRLPSPSQKHAEQAAVASPATAPASASATSQAQQQTAPADQSTDTAETGAQPGQNKGSEASTVVRRVPEGFPEWSSLAPEQLEVLKGEGVNNEEEYVNMFRRRSADDVAEILSCGL